MSVNSLLSRVSHFPDTKKLKYHDWTKLTELTDVPCLEFRAHIRRAV